MNSGDKTGFVARLKKTVFSSHGLIFSRRDHIFPVDEIGPDNNSREIMLFIGNPIGRSIMISND